MSVSLGGGKIFYSPLVLEVLLKCVFQKGEGKGKAFYVPRVVFLLLGAGFQQEAL